MGEGLGEPQVFRPVPLTKEGLCQFHAQDYVSFLQHITPDNQVRPPGDGSPVRGLQSAMCIWHWCAALANEHPTSAPETEQHRSMPCLLWRFALRMLAKHAGIHEKIQRAQEAGTSGG